MQVFSATDRPPRRRLPAARAVAARHGDRAAGDRRRARPRLGLLRRGLGRRRRRAPAIASATSPSAAKLWPLTSASQCGSAATMPPARTANASAPTRGLTHTIRWASRASRAISRPTSSGSPRSQPSETITTTDAARHPAAAVAVVERLQRVADPGAAGPVGRRRGGALDRALGMAAAQRAREARQPRGERERLDRGPAARRGGEQLQVGARVGLHRARDVAQQHEPAALHAAPAVREADRLAAAAQAAAQRPPQVDLAARGGRARSGACAAAAAPARAAPSAGRAARARPARARRSGASRAAPRRRPRRAGSRPPPRRARRRAPGAYVGLLAAARRRAA